MGMGSMGNATNAGGPAEGENSDEYWNALIDGVYLAGSLRRFSIGANGQAYSERQEVDWLQDRRVMGRIERFRICGDAYNTHHANDSVRRAQCRRAKAFEGPHDGDIPINHVTLDMHIGCDWSCRL